MYKVVYVGQNDTTVISYLSDSCLKPRDHDDARFVLD